MELNEWKLKSHVLSVLNLTDGVLLSFICTIHIYVTYVRRGSVWGVEIHIESGYWIVILCVQWAYNGVYVTMSSLFPSKRIKIVSPNSSQSYMIRWGYLALSFSYIKLMQNVWELGYPNFYCSCRQLDLSHCRRPIKPNQ